jgi:hypothetical protein
LFIPRPFISANLPGYVSILPLQKCLAIEQMFLERGPKYCRRRRSLI